MSFTKTHLSQPPSTLCSTGPQRISYIGGGPQTKMAVSLSGVSNKVNDIAIDEPFLMPSATSQVPERTWVTENLSSRDAQDSSKSLHKYPLQIYCRRAADLFRLIVRGVNQGSQSLNHWRDPSHRQSCLCVSAKWVLQLTLKSICLNETDVSPMGISPSTFESSPSS